MIHKEYGLMLFADAQPSEQIDSKSTPNHCLVSALCMDPSLVSALRQYKDTEAKARPETAKQLAKILKENNSIRAIGFIVRPESIGRYGSQFLSTVPEKAIKKHGSKYKVDKNKISEKLVKFLPWYAVCLCLTGLRGATWAKKLNITKVTLILDKLPVSPSSAMEMVRRISHHPELLPLWKETQEKYGVQFQITNMQSYKDPEGNTRTVDEHPCMILADWLSHSMYAVSNEAKDLDGIADRSEEYRKAIAEPWFALYGENRFDLVPVDSIVLGESNAPNNTVEPTQKPRG